MYRTVFILAVLFGTLEPADKVSGGISSTGPFIGDFQESWEPFDNYRVNAPGQGFTALENPTPIFASFASLSHPLAVVFENNSEAGADLLSSGDAMAVEGAKGMGLGSNGPQILPEYVADATISFSKPVIAFGGYWGAATGHGYDPEIIEFDFYDAAGNLLDEANVPYSRSFTANEDEGIFFADGQLIWAGWEFDVPISRIVFGGGFIVNDFLQATPIPEPSTATLAFLALVALAFGRRMVLDRP